MPPNPQVKEDDLRAVVKWILEGGDGRGRRVGICIEVGRRPGAAGIEPGSSPIGNRASMDTQTQGHSEEQRRGHAVRRWSRSAGCRPATRRRSGWNKAAFDSKTLDDTFKALGGGGAAQTRRYHDHDAPDIAENGAVVPVGVESSCPETESIALLVEKNPNPLAAAFDIPAGTEPSVTTRVKMGQSSNVYALVKADGKFYVAKKEIKVTLGGCGG